MLVRVHLNVLMVRNIRFETTTGIMKHVSLSRTSTNCWLQLTFLSSGLRLGSGASSGLGGRRVLSWNRLTALRASTSSSGTPLSPPRAADSWDRFGKGCGGISRSELFQNNSHHTRFNPPPHLGELVKGLLAVQLLRGGGGVSVGGRPLLIGWLHAGVTIATIGRGLIGHIIGRRC